MPPATWSCCATRCAGMGIPAALYRDRHTIFQASDRALALEEQLADARLPTQVGRALAELGITSIPAGSPQAKGRVERLWGTFQDRPVSELRLAGADHRDAANRVLSTLPAPLQPPLHGARGRCHSGWRAAPDAPRPSASAASSTARRGQRPHRAPRRPDPAAASAV